MDLNINIKNISPDKASKLRIKCADCNFWFEFTHVNFVDNLANIKNVRQALIFIKEKMFERTSRVNYGNNLTHFSKNGGRVKAAFTGKECIGILLAGKYYLFPKIKTFNIYPPDHDSIFLGCIHVIPEYRDMGIEKRLLIDLEKELIGEKINSIETVGKRLDDDMEIDEYNNSPLIPTKFLIHNGFYIKKNDNLHPLMRLDLKSISFNYLKEEVLSRLAVKNSVRKPAVIE